ncbi:sensor histidine kinase [Rufibacter radiotolerans]|uniref:sensor histidine kinase n=1 Tax=Rufibacter radiotolerans TaxID=1379910 RepID=UPI0006647ADE|nr:HAMP domain-containing sensor histidine kinase [Rufibacter radiotolerans]
MKLLNHATAYFAGLLLLVITLWAGLFYVNMLDEIYDSMDDGLENQKILVMQQALKDSTVLAQKEFDAGYYKVQEISARQALKATDLYQDTLMYMQNEKDFEPVRMLTTVFQRQGKYYQLRLITSMVEEDDLIEDLLYSLLWLYIGLIATLLLLNNLLLKRIWRPFNNLVRHLRTFKLEDAKPLPLQKTSIEEFQLLNQTVDKLLQKNVATYQSQKSFIENASHELQTPLAISLNKLELLAETQPLQENQLLKIGDVMENLERLTRLNKSLLLLSKIENQQFVQEEEVALPEIIQKAVSDFSDQIAFKQISLELQLSEGVTRKMNPDLALVLVMNLLKNALVHNVPGGFIQVDLTSQALSIKNSGPAAPLDASKIFTRFYKDANATASTGLGLAIVQAICAHYGFKIQYTYQQGHLFTISFPKKEHPTRFSKPASKKSSL